LTIPLVLAKAVPAEVSVSDEVLFVMISSSVTLVLMDIDDTRRACRRVGICSREGNSFEKWLSEGERMTILIL